MRNKREKKTENSTARIWCLLLAALMSISVCAALRFNDQRDEAYAQIAELQAWKDAQLSGQSEATQALAEKDAQISVLDAQIADLSGQIAQKDASIEYLQDRLNTKQLTGLDPEHPDYMDKYPDFYAPQPLSATKVETGAVYLTFDDGPSVNTEQLLNVLAENDVKATFFVVKKTDSASEARLKAIAEAGHTIAMHSASHNYNKIYASVDAFLADLYECFTWIKETTGVTPTMFRFPGGSINSYNHSTYQEITAEMIRRGFVPYDWNVSSGDATKNTVETDAIISNTLSGCSTTKYSVVLMHDGYYKTTTIEALPTVIAALKEQGRFFLPLDPEVKPTLFQYIDGPNSW